MAQLTSQTQRNWASLCDNVKQLIPREIGEHAWEVIIAAALITSPEPQLLGDFYTHLTHNDAAYSTEEAQRRLSLRFRDAVLKLITLVGAPQVISALMPLAKAEGHPEEKAKTSSLNPKWLVDGVFVVSDILTRAQRQNVDVSSIHARGVNTIDTIYGPLLSKIFQSWGDHTLDMQWNELFSVYGLYLSDFELMTALETEAVVFTTICCTGLRGPSLWHMRGMGRLLGARGTDETSQKMHDIKNMLRNLKVGAMTIVEWVGEEYVSRARLSAWVNVGDVVRELESWGDD